MYPIKLVLDQTIIIILALLLHGMHMIDMYDDTLSFYNGAPVL